MEGDPMVAVSSLQTDLKNFYHRNLVLERSKSGSTEKDKFILGQIHSYLECTEHEKKFMHLQFDDHIAEQVKSSECDFIKMSLAFKSLEMYAFNLVAYPWRKLFTVIKEHGFYMCKLSPYVSKISKIWNAMGYSKYSSEWRLDETQQTDLTELAVDLLIAATECLMMHELYQKIIIYQKLPASSIPAAVKLEIIKNVCDARVLCRGNVDECFEWLLANQVLDKPCVLFDNIKAIGKGYSPTFVQEDDHKFSLTVLNKGFHETYHLDYDDGSDADLYGPSPSVKKRDELTQDEHIEASLAAVLHFDTDKNKEPKSPHSPTRRMDVSQGKSSSYVNQYHSLQSGYGKSNVEPRLVPTARSQHEDSYTHGRSLSDSDNVRYIDNSKFARKEYTEKQDLDVGKEKTGKSKESVACTKTLLTDVGKQYTSAISSRGKIKYPETDITTSTGVTYENIKIDSKKVESTHDRASRNAPPPKTEEIAKLTSGKQWTCPVCINFNHATASVCSGCKARKDELLYENLTPEYSVPRKTSENDKKPTGRQVNVSVPRTTIPGTAERSNMSGQSAKTTSKAITSYVSTTSSSASDKTVTHHVSTLSPLISDKAVTSYVSKTSPKIPDKAVRSNASISSADVSGKADRSSVSASTAKTSSKAERSKISMWECPHCTTSNQTTSNVCVVCNKSKDFAAVRGEKSTGEGKICPTCTFINLKRAIRCKACQNELPRTTETSV
ncbi:uncharacterized protein LOC144436477 [Glandiceps talaboti]